MTATWLDDFEIIGIPGRLGGAYDRTEKWKACLHTTEGSSIEGAVAAYRAKGVPPHITVDPWKRRKAQHISLDRHSLSLRNSEAEDEPVIQVEMVGFAGTTQDWSNEIIEWLAVEVFAPIREVCPFELAYPAIGFGGSEGYGRNGAFRLTMAEWESFSGIVGHCHSPSPDTHWDPGDFRIEALLEAIDQADRTPPILTQDQEPNMLEQFIAAAYVDTRGYNPFRTGDDETGTWWWVRTAASENPTSSWTWQECLDSPTLGTMVSILVNE